MERRCKNCVSYVVSRLAPGSNVGQPLEQGYCLLHARLVSAHGDCERYTPRASHD